MEYVGVDPSLDTGFVILGDNDEIITEVEVSSKKEKDPQRMMDIASQLVNSINDDSVVVVEGFSYQSKGRGISFQYGLGWIIRAYFIENNIDYIEAPPAVVKKFATGKGQIKKDNMVLPIYKKWGFENESDNIRDAFVMAKIAQALNDVNTTSLVKYQKDALASIHKEG